ncbi:hypothetical protein LXL04_000989 [Taraxacum kok-saghyz]
MDTSKEVSTMENVFCSLTDDDLTEIRDNFKIDPALKLVLPTSNQTIKNPPEGFVGIYHQFLKAGLRFPVFDFLKTVLSHYNLHIAQLAPNSFRKIICFVMLSRALGVPPNLTLFRHFYVTLNAGDWISFTRRQGVDDICDGIPSSIKRWKPEFIFVDAVEFSPNMVFGDYKNKVVDPPPDLTAAQQVLIDQMIANPVKWSDPDELMLGMAGLSSHWTKLGKQPIFMVGGKVVTLLDRLQRRKFTGATEVREGPILDFLGPSVLDTALEDESSMDSANQTEGDRDCTGDVARTGRHGLKSDRIAGRPPSHPSRPTKDMFILKKRNVGGSSSPDSEKGKSGSGDVKDSSQSKRRCLVRGGRHASKVADVEDQKLVTPAVVVSVGGPDVPPTSLYECPVSADAALEGVTVASDTSPVSAIFFPPSQLPSTASLTRSVDLPLPKPTESSSVSGATVVPPSVCKPTGIPASGFAFRKALRGAGFGFVDFAPAVISTPDPITLPEKQANAHVSSPAAENLSLSQPEALLSVPVIPSSPEVTDDTVVPDSPSTAKVSLPSCSSSIPTLVSLAATLPSFQRPFVTSSVGRTPGLGDLSEEEGLDRARSMLLEGIHWANGVMLRQRTRASVLAVQQAECERMKKSIEHAHADHVTMVEGKLKLVRELQQVELRNQELIMEIDGMKEKQKELMNARQSIEKQLEDAHRHREFDLKKLEEVGQQLESLKLLFSEKVAGLEIACNQKDVVLTRQGCEIEEQKAQLLRLEDQVRVLTSECSAAKQAELFHQQMSEQHAGDLSWLLKHGIALSVRAILNSEEFGNLNAACQTASIQVGLTQACLEMKARYPVLEAEPLLHSYPRSQEEMLDRFSQMTDHAYQLLEMLRGGSVGVEYLKKYLEEDEGEEVNVAGGESTGNADLKSVRAGSIDSARLNAEDRGDSKMSEDRARKSGSAGKGDELMLGVDGKVTKVVGEKEAKEAVTGEGKHDDSVGDGASKLGEGDDNSGGAGDKEQAGASSGDAGVGSALLVMYASNGFSRACSNRVKDKLDYPALAVSGLGEFGSSAWLSHDRA